MPVQETYTRPGQPRPITNESFIGDIEPDPLEDIYNQSSMDSFWEDLSGYAPEEREIYERNAHLVKITEGVVRGDREMTGSIQDIREVCELFFERQGSINPMRGGAAPDRMLKVAGRYLECCANDKTRLDRESIPYGQLPRYVAHLFGDGNIKQELERLSPIERGALSTMLLEVAHGYDNNVATQGKPAEALRNTFEKWALQTLGSINGEALSGVTAPNFLQQYKRAAWASQYDVRFAQIARIADPALRETEYRKILGRQLAEAGTMLRASAIPQGRDIDGFLYEYFLPVSVRFNALMAGQQDLVGVRRATVREDSPIDGMTHPQRTEEYDRYSFDMLLRYPEHDRLVFLQTKLGKDATGYDEGIRVYNYHTNVPNIRSYMATVVGGMHDALQGNHISADVAKALNAERLRTAALLPETIE